MGNSDMFFIECQNVLKKWTQTFFLMATEDLCQASTIKEILGSDPSDPPRKVLVRAWIKKPFWRTRLCHSLSEDPEVLLHAPDS